MPLTDAQRKDLILAEVGDDGTAEGLWDAIWEKAAASALLITASTSDTYQDLQDAYAKIRAIDVLLGSVRTQVSAMQDRTRIELRELTANLPALRDAALA